MSLSFARLDELKAKLDAYRPLPARIVAQLRDDYRVRFTYHSNAIEGNTLTIYETKAVLEDGITIGGKTMREHLETLGHSYALDYLEHLVQQKKFLTEQTLKELHNIILRDIDRVNAGTYRKVNVLISGATHVPPPATVIQSMMEDFFEWYRSTAQSLHPVERAARVHSDFVNIHPFIDGNGRTARIIMNLELMKAGFPVVIIPVESRSLYYQNLDLAATNGDYVPFISQLIQLTIHSFEPYWGLLNI